MPTAHTSTGKSTTKRSAAAKGKSAARGAKAVNLLEADHREVEKLFGQFEKTRDEGRKDQLARQICLDLRVHTAIEEEIFYPACREVLKDDEIINESFVEHQAAKDLIEQIEGMAADDEMFDAKLTVLKEMIEHHVREEEKTLFPQVRKTGMDLQAIGDRLMERKEALMAEMDADVRRPH